MKGYRFHFLKSSINPLTIDDRWRTGFWEGKLDNFFSRVLPNSIVDLSLFKYSIFHFIIFFILVFWCTFCPTCLMSFFYIPFSPILSSRTHYWYTSFSFFIVHAILYSVLYLFGFSFYFLINNISSSLLLCILFSSELCQDNFKIIFDLIDISSLQIFFLG